MNSSGFLGNPWGFLAIVLLFGFLFYLRYSVTSGRGLGAWLKQRNEKREIHLVEQMGIAPRTSLLLVEVRGQSFLVAHSSQAIQVTPLPSARAEVQKPDLSKH